MRLFFTKNIIRTELCKLNY